jgi:hypothetical protein
MDFFAYGRMVRAVRMVRLSSSIFILAHLFYIPKAPGRPTSTLRRYGG